MHLLKNRATHFAEASLFSSAALHAGVIHNNISAATQSAGSSLRPLADSIYSLRPLFDTLMSDGTLEPAGYILLSGAVGLLGLFLRRR